MRIIPALDERPAVVAFVRTPAGAVLMVSAFAGLLGARGHQGAAELWGLLLALTLFPAWRAGLVLAGTVYGWFVYRGLGVDSPEVILADIGVRFPPVSWPAWILNLPTVLAVVLAFLALYWLAVRRLAVARPVLALVTFYLGLVHVACYAPLAQAPRTYLWAVLVTLGMVLWYYAYALLERNVRDNPASGLRIGALLPFWGGTQVPIPRGAATLGRLAAKSADELAVTQLKGVKLLLWTMVLTGILYGFGAVVYVEWRIPVAKESLIRYADGRADPRWLCWAALVCHMIAKLLSISVWGHTVVAILRMAGFRARRNTWRPLEAGSLLDFYNRFYFYYKELLVDFFFYPTYARWFVKSPRLRIFFAMLVAVGPGNFLFHYLQRPEYMAAFGFWGGVYVLRGLLVYTLILAVALGLSQVSGPPAPDSPWRFLTRAWVLFFFTVMSVFDLHGERFTPSNYLGYIGNLFGIP